MAAPKRKKSKMRIKLSTQFKQKKLVQFKIKSIIS